VSGDGVLSGGYRHDDGAVGRRSGRGWVVEAVHLADGSEEARTSARDFVADTVMSERSMTSWPRDDREVGDVQL